jgi:hypothetical protein
MDFMDRKAPGLSEQVRAGHLCLADIHVPGQIFQSRPGDRIGAGRYIIFRVTAHEISGQLCLYNWKCDKLYLTGKNRSLYTHA